MRFTGVVAAAAVLVLSGCSGNAGPADESADESPLGSVEELALTEAQWREQVLALDVPESHLVVAETAAKTLCARQNVEDLAILLNAALNATEPDLIALPDGVYGLGVRHLCPEQAGSVGEAIDLLQDLRTGDDPLCSLKLDEAYEQPEARQLLWSNVCVG